MSEMTFTVRDADRAIHSHQHGSLLDLLVAGLSAEPETIEELDAALLRFVQPGPFKPLAGWQEGACDEPYDAGICVLDLSARLVATESTYSTPIRSGLRSGSQSRMVMPLPVVKSIVWSSVAQTRADAPSMKKLGARPRASS